MPNVMSWKMLINLYFRLECDASHSNSNCIHWMVCSEMSIECPSALHSGKPGDCTLNAVLCSVYIHIQYGMLKYSIVASHSSKTKWNTNGYVCVVCISPSKSLDCSSAIKTNRTECFFTLSFIRCRCRRCRHRCSFSFRISKFFEDQYLGVACKTF